MITEQMNIRLSQYLREDFTFVPITISHVPLKYCLELGEVIQRVIQQIDEPVLIVASTDMNHFADQKTTLEKDQWAIDQVLARDPEGLYKTVLEKQISMCGIMPTTIMLHACNQLGASKATLVDHKTSGDVSGDRSRVVGYAGAVIS